MRENNSKKPFFNKGKEKNDSSKSFDKGGYKGKSDSSKSKDKGGYKGKSDSSQSFDKGGFKSKSGGFTKWKQASFGKPAGKRTFDKKEESFPEFEKKPRNQREVREGFKTLGEKKLGSKTSFLNKNRETTEKREFFGDKKQFFDKKEGGSTSKSFKKGTEQEQASSGKSGGLIYKGRGRDQKPVFAEGKPTFKSERSTPKSFGKKKFVDKGAAQDRPDYNFDALPQKKKRNEADELIRLNKYIANSGICSRREADQLIHNGMVTVNGEVCTELGRKVKRTDRVVYQGKKINPEKPVYVLLNKPKDFITTTDDPLDRKTVMNLVANACEERIFPIGRLDRNTTGLLLFTNDGELAAKLSHPSNEIKKIYQVTLDKPLAKNDEAAIQEGLTLEDGEVEVDDMQVLSADRKILGLEIHVGRNRIVRRIFAHLGYEVTALDRVVFAGLDKKDLKRGNYRFLTEKEVIRLKFFV